MPSASFLHGTDPAAAGITVYLYLGGQVIGIKPDVVPEMEFVCNCCFQGYAPSLGHFPPCAVYGSIIGQGIENTSHLFGFTVAGGVVEHLYGLALRSLSALLFPALHVVSCSGFLQNSAPSFAHMIQGDQSWQ